MVITPLCHATSSSSPILSAGISLRPLERWYFPTPIPFHPPWHHSSCWEGPGCGEKTVTGSGLASRSIPQKKQLIFSKLLLFLGSFHSQGRNFFPACLSSRSICWLMHRQCSCLPGDLTPTLHFLKKVFRFFSKRDPSSVLENLTSV